MNLTNCRIYSVIEHVDTLYLNSPANSSVLLPTADDNCATAPESVDLAVLDADRTLEEVPICTRTIFSSSVSEALAGSLVAYLRDLWNRERNTASIAYALYAMDGYLSSDADTQAKEAFFHMICATDKSIGYCFQTRFRRQDCFRDRVDCQAAAIADWTRDVE